VQRDGRGKRYGWRRSRRVVKNCVGRHDRLLKQGTK
jgi:hypothetical protein